jgi:hypothetical protein
MILPVLKITIVGTDIAYGGYRIYHDFRLFFLLLVLLLIKTKLHHNVQRYMLTLSSSCLFVICYIYIFFLIIDASISHSDIRTLAHYERPVCCSLKIHLSSVFLSARILIRCSFESFCCFWIFYFGILKSVFSNNNLYILVEALYFMW